MHYGDTFSVEVFGQQTMKKRYKICGMVLVVLVGLGFYLFKGNYDRLEDPAHRPRNIEECFRELKAVLPRFDLLMIRYGDQESMIRYHMSLGMALRNCWGLWQGSELSKYFNSMGVYHPDDMSSIILTCFWRHLRGQPIRLEEQAQVSIEYWRMHGSVEAPSRSTRVPASESE